MCSQISDTLDHSPTYPGRRSKRLTKKKVRTTGSLCASLLGVFIISLVNSTDPQEWSDKLHGLDQSTPDQSRDEIDGSLGWKSSSSESLSLLSVAYPVSEIDTLPISTSGDLPENDRHISPSDPAQDQQRWTAQYTNRSLESQSTSPLLSTPLILIQDPSDSRPVQALDQLDLTYDGSDQTSSPDSVSRKDSSPLRLFFPSDPSPSSIPLNSVNLDRPRESHPKRWLGARQVLVTTSYPGTDTVFATKTVTVNAGSPQPTPVDGAPVVVVIYNAPPAYPAPTPISTVTIDHNKYPAPYTTTLYPHVVVATVTVLSSANTRFDSQGIYRSIWLNLFLVTLGFTIGFMRLL